MKRKVKAVIRIILIIFLSGEFSFSYAQNFVLKRLQKIEQSHPEKLKSTAERYINVFPEKPIAYYFLAKIEMAEFRNLNDETEKYKSIKECIHRASQAQKIDKNNELLNQDGWQKLHFEIKNEAYFFFKEADFSDKIKSLKRKYYLFLSNGESEYLMDRELGLAVPKDQQIDSLFYGMPTGNEIVKTAFPEEELKMLSLINDERLNQGLSTLILDSAMSNACRYHGYDMATHKYLGHFGYDLGSDGRVYFANSTFDRIRQFYNETRVLGENISWGRNSAYFTYKGWYNSPGHNKIMFNPLNNRVGIGMVYVTDSEFMYYWVLCTAE